MPVKLINHLPQYIDTLDSKVNNGAERTAQRIAESASAKAPRDTGYLSEHIEARGLEVVADADYAAVVELGGRNTAPQPYMLPAFDAEKGNVAGDVREALS